MPGWDTHGLPIELKVLQALPDEARRGLDTLGLRAAAREYALDQVNKQREQFKRCAPKGGSGVGARRAARGRVTSQKRRPAGQG